MTTNTIQLIAFIFLLVHGIGHFQGVAAALGIKINNRGPANSRFLKNKNEKTNKTVCFILFLITGILGILTALSFSSVILPENLWQLFGIITAVMSTICLIAYINAFAMFFNKAGAILVNLFLYVTVLGNQDVLSFFIAE